MTENAYIEQRLQKQQQYHSRKSSDLKKKYIYLSVIALILSAAIPVVTYLMDIIPLITKIIITIISGASTVITGYLSLSKTHELFVEYRMISERLKTLEFLYKYKAQPFNGDNAFELLVLSCENIINRGNDNWHSTFVANQEPAHKS